VAGGLIAQPVYPHSRLDWTDRSCPEFAHYGRRLRVKGGCGRSADGAAGVPPASEITPLFRDLRFVPENEPALAGGRWPRDRRMRLPQ
jgi:hypothetical protein